MTAQLRQGIVAVVAVLALAVVCAVSWTPRPAADTGLEKAARPTPPAASARPESPPPGDATRNVFMFADRVPAPAEPLPPLAVPPPVDLAVAPVPTVSPVRLVGYVRRGGALHAALSLSGSISVLAVGEESDGYVVLAIDEDAGVSVRLPDGSQRVLPPPGP